MSISDTVNQLSTSELLEYVHDKSAVIIDIRTVHTEGEFRKCKLYSG